MRGLRAAVSCLLAALALSGCVYSSGPMAQPQGGLDDMAYAPAPVAYAAAPVACDTAYRLDAGDKLRIVVYGQEGLTNTYAIDAGGSITMPLIGAVPARGRT